MRTTRRFRSAHLPLLAVALLSLLAGACAGEGELGGPTVGGTPAASIGDHAVSNGDLEDEVEAWAANTEMLQAIGLGDSGTAGRRSAQLTTFVLSHRVVSEQARLMLADARTQAESGAIDLAELGVNGEALADPTETDVERVVQQLDQQFTGPDGRSVFAGFSEEFRRQLATDLAYQERLQLLLQAGLTAPDVEINPRYGRAEELQGGIVQVVPPAGPRPAPVAGSTLGV